MKKILLHIIIINNLFIYCLEIEKIDFSLLENLYLIKSMMKKFIKGREFIYHG